jgi:Siphovirus Gp157
MNKAAEIFIVRQQIEALLAQYPELAEDEVLRADMFEGETDLTGILRDLEAQRQHADALEDAIGETIKQLTMRCGRFQRRQDALRAMMLALLQTAQLRKVELPEATLSIRSAPARVIIHDEAELPEVYWRIKREPDKVKIKEALVTAAVVPGASLSNSPDTLAIRVK